uniref:SFRICE_022847 n=1 Tax=Spodoptera frugiperda TaxID=7108 RepID=A0A2H1WZX2_SPOFR
MSAYTRNVLSVLIQLHRCKFSYIYILPMVKSFIRNPNYMFATFRVRNLPTASTNVTFSELYTPLINSEGKHREET